MKSKNRGDKPRTRWQPAETMALIQLYNVMLRAQGCGQLGPRSNQTSKAAHVRQFITMHAPDRSKGSVEAKLMNVSYCRTKMNLPIIIGFKPLANCSTDLRDAFGLDGAK